MLETLEDENANKIKVLGKHPFVQRAFAQGDPPNDCTILVPLFWDEQDNTNGESFEEFLSRHTADDIWLLGYGKQDLVSCDNLIYCADQHEVAGCKLHNALIDVQYKGCILHAVEAKSLPELRPRMNFLSGLTSHRFLSGQEIRIEFDEHESEEIGGVAGRAFTLCAQLNDETRMKHGNETVTAWKGHRTQCTLKLPVVSKPVELGLWFQLYDNSKQTAIMYRKWPWYFEVLACPESKRDVSIQAINPQRGAADDELWVLGTNFTDISTILVGSSLAQPIYVLPNLIRCWVPPGSGKQYVSVCNGNVVNTYARPFEYA